MSSCSSQVIFVLLDLSSAPHLCMVLPATLFSFSVYSWGDLTHVWVFLSLKKKKEISFLFKNWNIVDIQYSVTFRHTTSWYDICIHYEMMTTLCLVTISPHMKLLQYYWSYSLHCIFTSPWPIFPTFLSWAEDVLPTSALDVTQKP